MIAIFVAAQAIAVTSSPACIQTRQAQLVEARELEARVQVLFDERKALVAQRAQIAKQRVKNEEGGSILRSLKDNFGGATSDASLDRRDAAYASRLNSIIEEAQLLNGDVQIIKIKHNNQLAVCSAGN